MSTFQSAGVAMLKANANTVKEVIVAYKDGKLRANRRLSSCSSSLGCSKMTEYNSEYDEVSRKLTEEQLKLLKESE